MIKQPYKRHAAYMAVLVEAIKRTELLLFVFINAGAFFNNKTRSLLCFKVDFSDIFSDYSEA